MNYQTGEVIQVGDRVTQRGLDYSGVVTVIHDVMVRVEWHKWDPAVEKPFSTPEMPDTLVLKARAKGVPSIEPAVEQEIETSGNGVDASSAPAVTTLEGTTADEPEIAPSVLAQYPYIALYFAGTGAVAALWDHYRLAVTPHAGEVQPEEMSDWADEIAAALIYGRYIDDVDRLTIAAESETVSPDVLALYYLHSGRPFLLTYNSMYALLKSIAGETPIHVRTQALTAPENYGYQVDPIPPAITAPQYRAGRYAQLVREGRCLVYHVESEQRRRVSHVTQDVLTGAWYAHLAGVPQPVRLLANEALRVERCDSRPSDPDAIPDFDLPKAKADTAWKFAPAFVAGRLRNRLNGLMVGRIESITHLHAQRFEVTFAHPLNASLIAQIAAEFESWLLAPFTLLVVVPLDWMEDAAQAPTASRVIPFPAPAPVLDDLDTIEMPSLGRVRELEQQIARTPLTLTDVQRFDDGWMDIDDLDARRLLLTVRQLQQVVIAYYRGDADADARAEALIPEVRDVHTVLA